MAAPTKPGGDQPADRRPHRRRQKVGRKGRPLRRGQAVRGQAVRWKRSTRTAFTDRLWRQLLRRNQLAGDQLLQPLEQLGRAALPEILDLLQPVLTTQALPVDQPLRLLPAQQLRRLIHSGVALPLLSAAGSKKHRRRKDAQRHLKTDHRQKAVVLLFPLFMLCRPLVAGSFCRPHCFPSVLKKANIFTKTYARHPPSMPGKAKKLANF